MPGNLPEIWDSPLFTGLSRAAAAFSGKENLVRYLNHIASDEKLWQAGYFVKPVKDKAFTGKIIQSLADLEGCGQENEDLAVLVSEPLELKQEWRCFIIYDQLVDVRPYQWARAICTTMIRSSC